MHNHELQERSRIPKMGQSAFVIYMFKFLSSQSMLQQEQKYCQ